MEAGMDFGGIWLLHIAVLGILDAKLFNKAPAEGESNVGFLVWGIIVLALAGLTVLTDLWGLIQTLQFFDAMFYAPAVGITGFLCTALEITLCVFLILSGVSRIRKRAPGKAVLKIILGACLGGLALTYMVIQGMMGSMYYY